MNMLDTNYFLLLRTTENGTKSFKNYFCCFNLFIEQTKNRKVYCETFRKNRFPSSGRQNLNYNLKFKYKII